jgi:hypothetical protein
MTTAGERLDALEHEAREYATTDMEREILWATGELRRMDEAMRKVWKRSWNDGVPSGKELPAFQFARDVIDAYERSADK